MFTPLELLVSVTTGVLCLLILVLAYRCFINPKYEEDDEEYEAEEEEDEVSPVFNQTRVDQLKLEVEFLKVFMI